MISKKKIISDFENGLISLDDIVDFVRADAIEECTETIRKGFDELLQSPWANKKYFREFDLSVKEVFEAIDYFILRKDMEQLKEQK